MTYFFQTESQRTKYVYGLPNVRASEAIQRYPTSTRGRPSELTSPQQPMRFPVIDIGSERKSWDTTEEYPISSGDEWKQTTESTPLPQHSTRFAFLNIERERDHCAPLPHPSELSRGVISGRSSFKRKRALRPSSTEIHLAEVKRKMARYSTPMSLQTIPQNISSGSSAEFTGSPLSVTVRRPPPTPFQIAPPKAPHWDSWKDPVVSSDFQAPSLWGDFDQPETSSATSLFGGYDHCSRRPRREE